MLVGRVVPVAVRHRDHHVGQLFALSAGAKHRHGGQTVGHHIANDRVVFFEGISVTLDPAELDFHAARHQRIAQLAELTPVLDVGNLATVSFQPAVVAPVMDPGVDAVADMFAVSVDLYQIDIVLTGMAQCVDTGGQLGQVVADVKRETTIPVHVMDGGDARRLLAFFGFRDVARCGQSVIAQASPLLGRLVTEQIAVQTPSAGTGIRPASAVAVDDHPLLAFCRLFIVFDLHLGSLYFFTAKRSHE